MVSIFFSFFLSIPHPSTYVCVFVSSSLSVRVKLGFLESKGRLDSKETRYVTFATQLCTPHMHTLSISLLYDLLSHRTERYLQYTRVTQPLSLQNDFSRCLRFSLRKFMCSPSTFVSVCKQNSNPSQSRVASRDSTILNRESCMSNVCFARKEIKLLILSDCLPEFLTFVCIGQGVQGGPGLPGIRGKPGPQVSSCLGMYS